MNDKTIKERVAKRNIGSESEIDCSFFFEMNKAYSNCKETFSKFINEQKPMIDVDTNDKDEQMVLDIVLKHLINEGYIFIAKK